MKKIEECNIIIRPTLKSPVHLSISKDLCFAKSFGFEFFDDKMNYEHNPHHIYLTSNRNVSKDSIVIVDCAIGKIIKIHGDTLCEVDFGWSTYQTKLIKDCSMIEASTSPSLNVPLLNDSDIAYCVLIFNGRSQNKISTVNIEINDDNTIFINRNRNDKSFTETDVKNALHRVEIKLDKNLTDIWDMLKQELY